jgi:hypothetical protein
MDITHYPNSRNNSLLKDKSTNMNQRLNHETKRVPISEGKEMIPKC